MAELRLPEPLRQRIPFGIGQRFQNGFPGIVINTVPAPMLTAARVAGMKPDALILDLASAPGGTDFEAARAFGIRALTAPGLPGKWSPQTAAEAVRDAVYNILEDEKA